MSDYDKIAYWVELADYDFETAKALLDSKRYLYVGFMCHQVVEKMLKAVYAAVFDELPPKIHDLKKLAIKTGVFQSLDEEQVETIKLLMPLNIETRYPDFKWTIAKTLNHQQCVEILQLTEALSNWIRKKLFNEFGNMRK